MSRDDYIKMAVDAGLKIGQHWNKHRMTTDNMVRFARIVAAAEREACAKVCKELADKARSSKQYVRADHYAVCESLIRAKGELRGVR